MQRLTFVIYEKAFLQNSAVIPKLSSQLMDRILTVASFFAHMSVAKKVCFMYQT